MDIEKSREVFNRMNEVYKRQQTNLKLLILRGPTSAGKTFCARKFSTNKIHDLKTEIDASSEANLYNSLHSLAKLLVTDNQYLIQQLADIHSIASNDIKKIEMINFVFSALQNYNSWFIIVDDVNDYKNIRIITAIARNFKSNGTLLFTINSRHKIDNNEFIVDVNGEENTLSQDHKALSVDHILNEISSAIFRNEFVNARQLVAELNHKILNKVQKIRLLISEAVLQMKLGHRSICNELLEYAFKLVTSENNTDDQMAILKSNIVKYRALNAYLNRINTSEMYTCINELNSALDVLNNCRPSQKVYVEIVDLLLTRSGMLVSTMQYSEAQQDLERAGFYMQQLTTKGNMYLFHKAKIAIDKGHIFLRTGYLEKAASCYANAKAIFTEIKSYDYMFRLLEQESEIFIRLGKLNAAEENCKIVIADHNVFDNPYNSIFVCTTYYNMAVIQYRKRNFEQSRYYFFRFFINVEQYISKMLPEKMEWFSKHKAKFYDTADLTNCFKNSLDIFKQICLPDSEFISDFVRQNYINSIENVVTD